MSFRMHFFFTDHGDFDWDALREGLQTLDPQFDIVAASPNVELRYGSELYGRMEIISPIDHVWVGELKEQLDDTQRHFREGRVEDDFNWEYVKSVLSNLKAALEINVMWQERQLEDTLQRIDPVWQWLFNHRSGAVYDGSGWYDMEGLIVPIVRPKPCGVDPI